MFHTFWMEYSQLSTRQHNQNHSTHNQKSIRSNFILRSTPSISIPGGSRQSYTTKFTESPSSGAGLRPTVGGEIFVSDLICQNAEDCTIGVQITMRVEGAFVTDSLAAVCSR